MSTYLLLRNNKESGPHSLEDLRTLSLKPYDLVWVEGKSAAWRYPGEINELKSFAPEVVEQPFDRFLRSRPQQRLLQPSERTTTPMFHIQLNQQELKPAGPFISTCRPRHQTIPRSEPQ